MRATILAACFGLGAFVSGCIIVEAPSDGDDDDDVPGACDLVARESIALRVLDERGAEVCDADVRVRQGASEWSLRSAGPAGGGCAWFGLPERPGTYDVVVTKAGYQTARRSGVVVRRTADGCHVESARVEVRLEPTSVGPGCTEQAVPSLNIEVRDERGQPACDATVVVRAPGFEESIAPGLGPGGACAWVGPFERPGSFDVTVSRPGYATQSLRGVTVVKDALGCHVVTTELDVRLVPEGRACTDVVVEPFDLDVRDEAFAEVCDADVTVLEGGVPVASLLPRAEPDGDCTWTGGPDRAGVYDLLVRRPGYAPVSASGLEVGLDAAGCHVVPVLVNVKLEPASVPVPVPFGG
jgi:hypothetical protein